MSLWLSGMVGVAIACAVAAFMGSAGRGAMLRLDRWRTLGGLWQGANTTWLRGLMRAIERWSIPCDTCSHPWVARYRAFLARYLSQLPVTRKVSPGQWMGVQLTSATIIGMVLVGGGGLRHPISLFLLMGLGCFWPVWWLRRAVHRRHQAVIRHLPETLELLTVMVEAGLDLTAALERVAGRGHGGPWREELGTVVQELRVGKSRSEALQHLADRAHHPWVVGITAQLIQATQMGASLGPLLRTQAKELRGQWFQWMEERAAQAPVRLLVPLAVFLLPAVLLVLLGPVVLLFTMGDVGR